MNKAKFYVNTCFEAGSFENGSGGHVTKQYWFEKDLTDEAFEELYQVWFGNNSELNNWDTNWEGHEALLENLNASAVRVLNELQKEHDPAFADPIDVYWEISKETEDAF